MRGTVDLVACLAMIAALPMIPDAAAQGEPNPASSVIYAASDFPALARGVDPGFVGEAVVSVWAPSQDDWSLTISDDGTATLNHRTEAGETTPRWQSLGTVQLVKGRALKIVVTGADAPK